MELMTEKIRAQLYANHEATKAANGDHLGHKPVVKYFNPMGADKWLISEMDAEGMMFGLCDLGVGHPELGYVSLEELESVKLPLGLSIERDLRWTANTTIREYVARARYYHRIVG